MFGFQGGETADIVRVAADQFHVDGYRYTHLADALAQARRSHRPDA